MSFCRAPPRLQLDEGKTLLHYRDRLARHLVGFASPEHEADRYAIDGLPAKQGVDRHVADLPDQIMEGEVDRGLRLVVVARERVHPADDLLDPGRILTQQDPGSEEVADHRHHRILRFPAVPGRGVP